VPDWLLWGLFAIALAAGEIFTPGMFFLGPLALAAAAAAIVAAAGGGWLAALLVFVGGSIASLLLLRPLARRHVRLPPAMRTGTAKLVGASAVVVERVDGSNGRVRIGGEVWSARSLDEHQAIEPGARVQVAEIDGATAVVYE
jgi:membrane protein implicated in regulation of membrane protease activity